MILQSMLGLYCDKKYGAMTKYEDRDEERDNDRNKYGNENDNNNSATRSVSYGPIFDPITTPWSRGGDRAVTVTALRPRRTMYLRFGLYIHPIKTILGMCHKLLYAKIGVLDLCC